MGSNNSRPAVIVHHDPTVRARRFFGLLGRRRNPSGNNAPLDPHENNLPRNNVVYNDIVPAVLGEIARNRRERRGRRRNEPHIIILPHPPQFLRAHVEGGARNHGHGHNILHPAHRVVASLGMSRDQLAQHLQEALLGEGVHIMEEHAGPEHAHAHAHAHAHVHDQGVGAGDNVEGPLLGEEGEEQYMPMAPAPLYLENAEAGILPGSCRARRIALEVDVRSRRIDYDKRLLATLVQEMVRFNVSGDGEEREENSSTSDKAESHNIWPKRAKEELNCRKKLKIVKSLRLFDFDDFHKRLDDLRKRKQFLDIVITVEKQDFPCHKLILVANSHYFENMFGGNFVESESKKVTLLEMSATSFGKILDLWYAAEIPMGPDDDAEELLKAAVFLQAKQLREICEFYIKNSVPMYNVVEIYFSLLEEQRGKLLPLLHHIHQKLEKMMEYQQYRDISIRNMKALIKNLSPNCERVSLLKAIFEWASYSEDRKPHVMELVEAINLDKCSMNEIAKMMASNRLVQSTPQYMEMLLLYFRRVGHVANNAPAPCLNLVLG